MKKAKFTLDNMIQAYDYAMDELRMQEADSDEAGDKECRKWLADKLNKEIDRIVAKRMTLTKSELKLAEKVAKVLIDADKLIAEANK